jgi:hypothetical protein
MTYLNLNPSERRLSIQNLMDGHRDRRRSSRGGGTAGQGARGTVARAATSSTSSTSTANGNGNINNLDIGQSAPGGYMHPDMHANLTSRVDFSTMTEAQKEQAKAVQIAISTRMDQHQPP